MGDFTNHLASQLTSAYIFSQYFRLLFLANTKLLSYIELRGVDPESVELLVNFAYTGTLNISYIRYSLNMSSDWSLFSQ